MPEPFGTLNRLALPYETYKLALTGPLLDAVFGDKLDAGCGRPWATRRSAAT